MNAAAPATLLFSGIQVIQLYETTLVRHGLMLVGPTMAGKTCCYKVLARALSALQAAGEAAYERVRPRLVNAWRPHLQSLCTRALVEMSVLI